MQYNSKCGQPEHLSDWNSTSVDLEVKIIIEMVQIGDYTLYEVGGNYILKSSHP